MSILRFLLPVVLGAAAISAACSADPADPIHKSGKGKGSNGQDADNTDPAAPGYNNPETPTNQGPSINPNGFAAIKPVVQKYCAECHHAGTWLPLEAGADQETAQKMVAAIEGGSMPPAPREKISTEDLERIKAWSRGEAPTASTVTDTVSQLPVTQLLAAGTLASYKAVLPKVGWQHLADVLAAPSTLFFDKATVPPAYQDTVGDGSSLPYGARFNNSGKSLIVPEGQKLFSADGQSWSYPFGHTAGADASTNAFIVNFVSFPEVGGKLAPVVYKVETGNVQSLPVKRWNWSYPKGAMVGEIIMIKDGASLVVSEIRVRMRYQDSWATNVFRPFPTAARLSAAIKGKNVNWQQDASLSSVVNALDNNGSLTEKQLTSPNFNNLVSLSGSADAPLPTLDPAFAKDLLTTTTFVGAYGTTYKTDGTKKAFGPTGPASGTSVFPIGFDTGLLEVRESTCTKCHDQGGYFIGDLVDQAILYGDIWGVDRVFSFHPFDPSKIDASGNENRSVRAGLTSVFVPYDATAHAGYTFYRPTKQ